VPRGRRAGQAHDHDHHGAGDDDHAHDDHHHELDDDHHHTDHDDDHAHDDHDHAADDHLHRPERRRQPRSVDARADGDDVAVSGTVHGELELMTNSGGLSP
jgi:hypothetical protein